MMESYDSMHEIFTVVEVLIVARSFFKIVFGFLAASRFLPPLLPVLLLLSVATAASSKILYCIG